MAWIENYQKWEPKIHAWECFDASQFEEGKIPVGIKDIINTVNFPTQRGSRLYQGFTPGNDARVVAKLKQAGFSIVGKTVTAEFAVHSPGKTRNPHGLKCTPGTSSSGSAAAVAAGMVPLALGTQTAGSIIRPASYCGVYAIKPSFGLIPRTGILKTADTLDTVGFFVEDPFKLRLLLDVLRVDGPNYPQTEKLCLAAVSNQYKVGILQPSVEKSWSNSAQSEVLAWGEKTRLAKIAGWNSVLDYAYDTHRLLYHKSLAYYFQREMQHPELVSDIFRQQVEEGLRTGVLEYRQALARQGEIAQTLERFFEDYDFLITASSAGPAPLDEKNAPLDTCLIWTLCGVPVINIPAFVSPKGLPFGLQVIARKYHDYRLLDFVEKLVTLGFAPNGPNPRLY